MTGISSRDNPRYKALRRLGGPARERRQAGLTLLDGPHLLDAYLARVGLPELVLATEAGLERPEVATLVGRCTGVELQVLSEVMLRSLSPVDTPAGILAVIRIPEAPTAPDASAARVLLEDVQDPGNLGSILRSVAAAGIREVHFSARSADPWSPKALRGGMGAQFQLALHPSEDLSALASTLPAPRLAMDQRGSRSLYDQELTGAVTLMFGNEGAGLSASLRATATAEVHIPMPGGTESLNLAASVAICLFERVRQLAVG